MASLVVPAASALLGVVASQAWTTWHERSSWMRQSQQRLIDERRLALSRFLVALNRAIDFTRHRALLAEDQHADDGTSLRNYHQRWNEAYECQLELLLLLPEDARLLVRRHLDRAFAWREEALAHTASNGAPVNEDLIQQLQRWIEFPGSRRRDSNPWPVDPVC